MVCNAKHNRMVNSFLEKENMNKEILSKKCM